CRPVKVIHTHRVGSWMAILRFHGCIEQGTLQHLPPPKRLQLVPITGLDFRLLLAPKIGALIMTCVHRPISPEVEAIPQQNILPYLTPKVPRRRAPDSMTANDIASESPQPGHLASTS